MCHSICTDRSVSSHCQDTNSGIDFQSKDKYNLFVYRQQTTNDVIETPSMKKSPTNEFEILTTSSLSSSISIVNCTTDDDFTPLSSPLYSTAIAYSPTTDII
jgi:hypothetical protein